MRCLAITKTGEQCVNEASKIHKNKAFCFIHHKIYHKQDEKINGGDIIDHKMMFDNLVNDYRKTLPTEFFDKYEMIEIIGKSAKAYIIKIKELKTSKIYALKFTYGFLNNPSEQEITIEKIIQDGIIDEYEFLKMIHSNKPTSIFENVIQNNNIIKIKDDSLIKEFKKIGNDLLVYTGFIIEYLEESLYDRCKRLNFKMKDKNIRQLALKLIDITQYLHLKKYVYIDFSLNNIMFRTVKDTEIQMVLIDFELVEKFWTDEKTREFKNGSETYGTLQYSSLSATIGNTSDRIDDIQSILYVLVHVCLGYLPWGKYIISHDKQTILKVYQEKLTFSSSKHFNKLPNWLQNIFYHLQKYTYYNEVPDYEKIKKIIQKTN